jgi:hypothetical protein
MSPNTEEMDVLKATVSRLEAILDERENDRTLEALREMQVAGEDEPGDVEEPLRREAGRAPFDWAGATKVANLEFDRHAPINRGMVGVVHVAKAHGPELDRSLWRARCGWRFGRKEKGWRILSSGENMVPYGVCDRCAAP